MPVYVPLKLNVRPGDWDWEPEYVPPATAGQEDYGPSPLPLMEKLSGAEFKTLPHNVVTEAIHVQTDVEYKLNMMEYVFHTTIAMGKPHGVSVTLDKHMVEAIGPSAALEAVSEQMAYEFGKMVEEHIKNSLLTVFQSQQHAIFKV